MSSLASQAQAYSAVGGIASAKRNRPTFLAQCSTSLRRSTLCLATGDVILEVNDLHAEIAESGKENPSRGEPDHVRGRGARYHGQEWLWKEYIIQGMACIRLYMVLCI